MFFRLGMKSFEEFTYKLIRLLRKSLTQSKQVLEERNRLEKFVEILTIKLRNGLDQVEYIKGILKMISSLKGDLNDSKNFTMVIKTPKIWTVHVPLENYMTKCMTCSTTCHKYCCISDNDDKRGCVCIRGDYCVRCKYKCHWT